MTEFHDRQQVNLLDPGFRARTAPLPALLLWAAGALVIAGLLAYYFVEREHLAALQHRVARLEARYSQRQAQLGEAGGPRRAAAAQREIARLTKERRAKGRVLNLLAGRGVGSTAGFSSYLEGLARQTQSGVWLRHIAIHRGGSDLSIAGSALEPTLVPRYLKRLAREPAYAGAVFRTFKMKRRTGTPAGVDFVVRTAAPEG